MEELLASPAWVEVCVSLHAATAKMRSLVVGASPARFDEIVDTLRALVRRRRGERLRLHLLFVTTRTNLPELSDFVRLDLDIGIDSFMARGSTSTPTTSTSVGGRVFAERDQFVARDDPSFEAQLAAAHGAAPDEE